MRYAFMRSHYGVLMVTVLLVMTLAVGCGSGGAKTGAKSMRGLNTIFDAAAFGSYESMIRFMGDGSSISERDQIGRTVLHYAAENGNIEIMNWLIYDIGFDPNVRDSEGTTPLALAQDAGQTEAIALLEEVGAQP